MVKYIGLLFFSFSCAKELTTFERRYNIFGEITKLDDARVTKYERWKDNKKILTCIKYKTPHPQYGNYFSESFENDQYHMLEGPDLFFREVEGLFNTSGILEEN